MISDQDAGGTIILARDRATSIASNGGRYSCTAFFPWGDPRGIEIYEMTIGAHHHENVPAYDAAVKKVVVVLAGKIEVTVANDAPALLSEGDAILFNGASAHKLHNPGDSDAKAFLAVAPAGYPRLYSRGNK